MTEIAYMVREDWAQWGAAMKQSSDTIRSWLDASRPVWAVGKPEKFNDTVRSADRETAVYISRSQSPSPVVDFGRMADVASRQDAAHLAVVALHPYEHPDCDALQEVVDSGRLGKVYVQIWAHNDMVRHWLEGIGAIDLHRCAPADGPDPLQVAACQLIVKEEYNGLSTGNGKATVIQLLRSFELEGYAPDPERWLRAYFAAGGSFRHADTVRKFVSEVRDGKRHRVPQRFRPEVVRILSEQVTQEKHSHPS
jgi:hypothetical protein